MRIAKYLVLILFLLQLPFCYRVCQTNRLKRFTESLPPPLEQSVPFQDLRGTIHVHSAAGSHSMGTYLELIAVAKSVGYDYLFLTEHPKEYVLFNQLTDPDLVVVYGLEVESAGQRFLESADARVKVASMLGEDDDVPADATGIEVFNIAESGRSHNNVFGWLTWLYHRFSYPDLFFFQAWEIDASRFRLWDRVSARRPLAAVAGNNAHQNIGLVLVTGAGRRVFSIFLDPYEMSFRFVTNHLVVPRDTMLDDEAVIDAFSRGASYIVFERIADPRGFSFHAENSSGRFTMGSQVPVGSALVFQSPYTVRFRLIRSGEQALLVEGSRFEYDAEEPGAYRLEVSFPNPPGLLEGKPWIVTNPIYVGIPSPE